MVILTLVLPLLTFFLISLFGRLLSRKGVQYLVLINLGFWLILSFYYFIEIIFKKSLIYLPFSLWFYSGILDIKLYLCFDKLSGCMIFLVSFVSFLVHIYSFEYMGEDPHFERFISYLSLFTFFMLVLITATNLIQLFIGWEGVGLCSYLLVNFWYTRIQANKSSIKAMLVNKVGDLGLLIGIVYLWSFFGVLDYDSLFSIILYDNNTLMINIICLFLLLGVIGKSAQLGLHTWLPDAMEGPTPVSALIHAATMVTAGVFLIIRLSPLFEYARGILLIIIFLGAMTTIFAASVGIVQKDLKKVIAYSTCSQLGYMVLICGFSFYDISLFHLVNHGIFKALLFLSAGSVVHFSFENQDIRKLGGFLGSSPITYIGFLIGSLSLMGLPFMTGFFSKDLLLEIIYSEHKLIYAYIIGIISALCTSFYSFRLLYFTFYTNPQNPYKQAMKNQESGFWILICLILLSIFSIIFGYFFQFSFFYDKIPPFIIFSLKNLVFGGSILFLSLAITLGIFLNYWKWFKSFEIFKRIYRFLSSQWYFNPIFNDFIYNPFFKLGLIIQYKLIDNQLLEKIGPKKSYKIFNNLSSTSSNYHLGDITTHLGIILLFIIIISIKY